MIIIEENITNKKIVYAEKDDELTNSLFQPVDCPGAENHRGTLALFYKIENKKNHIFYWVDDSRGYFLDKKRNLWGQFGLINGRKWCQHTLAQITRK